MKPKLKKQSIGDGILKSVISCISEIDCSNFFKDHIGKSQTEQKAIINKFQTHVQLSLQNALKDIDWKIEYRPNPSLRDSIDIFGKSEGFVVVIELDKNRADQVAKKFVSRIALLPSTKIYFVSLCYPGTKNMKIKECIKYFEYCSALAVRMDIQYAGLIIS